jgi:putative transposase
MGAVVSRLAGHWYVSIPVEMEKPRPEVFQKPVVGVDMGLKMLAVLSDGEQYENQVLLRSELIRLKRLNRRLSRREVGSSRWRQATRQLERFHARIANRRADSLHKMTTEIARKYAVVGLEDLNVAGMLQNHRLALSLSDAAFGEIRRQLAYKCEWFGGRMVTVNRFFPSTQLCGTCGAKNDALELSDRQWICPTCGMLNLRDPSAARNIELETLRILAQTPVVATSG